MTDVWPFDQERNVAAITSRQVVREGAVIRLVVHYSDDHSWAFLDSEHSKSSDWLVVGMGTVADKDPSLAQIADLPPGWIAMRDSAGSPWTRQPDPDT